MEKRDQPRCGWPLWVDGWLGSLDRGVAGHFGQRIRISLFFYCAIHAQLGVAAFWDGCVEWGSYFVPGQVFPACHILVCGVQDEESPDQPALFASGKVVRAYDLFQGPVLRVYVVETEGVGHQLRQFSFLFYLDTGFNRLCANILDVLFDGDRMIVVVGDAGGIGLFKPAAFSNGGDPIAGRGSA